jgi:hypothetical protein
MVTITLGDVALLASRWSSSLTVNERRVKNSRLKQEERYKIWKD